MTIQDDPNADPECQLACGVCQAIDEGDDARLMSLLNIKKVGSSITPDQRSSIPRENQPPLCSVAKVEALLRFFYNLIGYQGYELTHERESEGIRYDASVKAHLVLSALLRVSAFDLKLHSVSWQAAVAAIQTLQFSVRCHTDRTAITHSDELRMVSELRSFLSFKVMSMMCNMPNDDEGKMKVVDQWLQHLLHLGEIIIAPLLQTNGSDTSKSTMTRRQHSYLLPLELIPALLSVSEELDDLRVEISECLGREEFALGIGLKETQDGMDIDPPEQENGANASCGERKITVRDTILTSLFCCVQRNNGLAHGSIRADAALPILALAIDDIGSMRMSSVCPSLPSSYWQCLRQALNNVFSSSVFCCAAKKDLKDDSKMVQKYISMREEMESDEGVHIIPHSDYPALLRCIFRMIISINSYQSSNKPTDPSWESLLLRFYHATIATTLSRRLSSSKKHSDMDRMSILSTVESHVLLPTFTGAPVSSVRSILKACSIECCASCRNDRLETTPTYFEAAPKSTIISLALLIMRARTSNVSHSLRSATGFGAHSVFRMTTEILCNKAGITEDQSVSNINSRNEFDMALKVLLELSEAESARCCNCSYANKRSGTEVAAYEVLQASYYGGNGNFIPRYQAAARNERTYRYNLGRSTLSKYANLVRASLNRCSTGSEKRHSMESFVADTARAWLDAAMLLLDDSSEEPYCGSFAIVIVVVIFCDVPSSRHNIIQSLYERLAVSATKDWHNNNSFSIVSTLVWSMASRDDTSSTVFSRKDNRHMQNMSVFEPLCSLLSRPVVSANRHNYGIFNGTNETSLSYEAMLPIAKTLVSVPSARELILSMAKKHMRVTSVVRSDEDSHVVINPQWDSVPCTQSANRDSVYFAAACLCMLIEQHSPRSTLDDCGCEALKQITDLIVLRRPSTSSSQLPKRVVSWIVTEITILVSLLRINVWACQRLLRASYFALSQCCTFEPKGYDKEPCATFSIGNTSSFVDLDRLLRLTITLSNQLDCGSISSRNSCRLHLLSAVLQRESVLNKNVSSFGVIEKGFANDESKNVSIDKALLSMFLRGSASMFHGNFSAERSHSPHSDAVEQYLLNSEYFHYLQRGNGSSNAASRLPDWIKNTNFLENVLTLQQKEFANSKSEISHIILPLSSLFIEIIANGELSTTNNNSTFNITQDSNAPIDLTNSVLIEGVTILWEMMQKECTTAIHLPHDTICNLIDMYSRQLEHLLKTSQHKHELAQLVVTINHLLNCCKLFTLKGKEHSFDEHQFTSLWNLYSSISNEYASRALISLLLNIFKETGWAPISQCDHTLNTECEDQWSCSLTTISSHDMLDEQVRFIRSSTVASLSELFARGFQTMLSPAEMTSLLRKLTQSLLKLCMDLSDGCQGESGGMTRSLFLLYAKAIEGCISNIATIVALVSVDTLRENIQHFVSLQKATVCVWNLFVAHSFEEASVVKSVFGLLNCISSLIQKIELIARRSIDTTTNIVPCVILLDQSIINLRKSIQETNMTTNNEDDGEHGDPDNHKQADFTISLDIEEYPITQLNKPKLSSANVVRSYSSALIRMATIWNESNKVITTPNPNLHSMIKDNSDLVVYAKMRTNSFLSIHSAICKMFGIIHIPKATSSTHEVSKEDTLDAANVHKFARERVVAEHLSRRGKSSLCSCLEKMLITLNSSIKTVKHSLCEDKADIKLFESLACIIGCFASIVSQKESNTFDSLTGPTRWLVAEYKTENYSLLHRLPKIVYRSETIQIELHNLCMLIQGLNERAPDELKEHMNLMNKMAVAYIPSASTGFAFNELLEQCARVVQSRMASLRTMASTAGFFSDEDGKLMPNTSGRFWMPLRSRNEIIDDWLTLDTENLTKGEIDADDAFVDLEDFIVEG